MVISIPTLNDSAADFERLFSIWLQANGYSLDIRFDFSDCRFLQPNAVAFLGGLARLIKLRSGTIVFDWDTVQRNVMTNLSQNGFAGYFGYPSPRWDGNSIPYREDQFLDTNNIMDHLTLYWIGKGWVRISEKGAVAKCAELVGNLQAVFNMTVKYAKERRQFGKPIGSFQAVQHHCANMIIDVDGSRFITYQAAWKISEGIKAEASMAKAWTSEASRRVTMLGHQIHGAISFCEEYDMHLYYRKAKACEIAFGDGNFHLEKVADQLLKW